MVEVNFYNDKELTIDKIKYVVVMARCNNKWIIVKNKDRDTWELPGGHVELGEDLASAAFRELFEETGSLASELTAVSRYSITDGANKTCGQLYFAEISEIGELPNFEIDEIKFVDELRFTEEFSNKLTYPLVQPYLFAKVVEYIKTYI